MQNTDEAIISTLLEESYLQGALNEMNTQAMRNGYHTDFGILYSEGEALQRLPLEDWIALIEAYKADSIKRLSGSRVMDYEIEHVEVTGNAAFAKIKLYRKQTLIFTDYLTLLKFNGHWKIVSKVYNAHVESPWE